MSRKFDLDSAIAWNRARRAAGQLTDADEAIAVLALQVKTDARYKDGKHGDETRGISRSVKEEYLKVNRTPPDAAPRCRLDDGVWPLAKASTPWRVLNDLGRHFGGPNKHDFYHCGHDPTRKMPRGAGYPVHDRHGNGASTNDLVLACLPGVVVDVHEPTERRRHYWGIVLAHNVEGKLYHSVYLHNDKHHAPLGEVVAGGALLANVGHTGTSLNHVHFSLHDDEKGDAPFVRLSQDHSAFWRWAYQTVINAGPWLKKWPVVHAP